MKYFFIGIKGSGMSALACLLVDLGHTVEGCDQETDFGFEEGLKNRSIKIFNFNDSINYLDYDYYIIGNAYLNHPLSQEIINKRPVCYDLYYNYLAKIPGYRIGISGTHGKTTTTKLLCQMLKDQKIATVIGDGTGYGVKDYQYFIFETCEYQDHFLASNYDILVITNIEYDHPDYFPSLDHVLQSFEKAKAKAKKVIVGSNQKYQILNQNQDGYLIETDNGYQYQLPFYGIHMINNFMVARAVMIELGLSDQYIDEKIKGFNYPKRRLEIYNYGSTILVDDYAHHPTEIKALYEGLKQKYPYHLIKVIFQPHTYSRTLTFSNDFIKVLKLFDDIYITDVFSSSRELKQEVKQAQIDLIFKDFKKFTPDVIKQINQSSNDCWVFLGAGVVDQYLKKLLES